MAYKQSWENKQAWLDTHTDRIVIKIQKSLGFPSRIAAAVSAGFAASQTDYIRRAVAERLEKDGFPLPAPGAVVEEAAPGEAAPEP